MRAALTWALERKEVEVALRLGALCGGSGGCAATTARADAGSKRRWQSDGRGSPESRAMALAGVGYLALEQGDLDRAKEACEEGLGLLETRHGREARLS